MPPLSVGLVGAGPWARQFHAPLLTGGPETQLAGVWSRTPASAGPLAERHAVPAFRSFADLLEHCEAVAFAVPPDVQAVLAIEAAGHGKAVLLEKPVALDVAGAERLAEGVTTAGVGSLVVLTYRFSGAVRRFLDEATRFEAWGGRGCFLSGAFLGGPYAGSPWRQQYGALLDVGPHLVDLLDAALGPVERVRAHGDPERWVGLLLGHAGGAVSEVSLSCRAGIEPSRTEVELFGPAGRLAVSRDDVGGDLLGVLRSEFARVARTGEPHPVDVHRGLHLQRIIASAAAQLAA
jgi:predicted dehydrogenase